MYRIFLFSIAFLFVFPVITASAQQTPNPLVELKNQYSGKCLAVRGGSAAHGATLIHVDCEPGGQNAIWEMRPHGLGYWIVNKHSKLCLGVAHQSTKDGEQVTQVSPCERPDTVWKLENVPPNSSLTPSPLMPPQVDYGNTFVIRNNNSNKCLALVTGSEIKQYGCLRRTGEYSDKTIWQFVKAYLDFTIAGRIPVRAGFTVPFKLGDRTYIFGSVSHQRARVPATNNAADSWLIDKDPKMGFTPMMQGAKMSSWYSAVTSFTLNNHPYIFGLHWPIAHGFKTENDSANIWRINDDGKGFELKVYNGKMSSNYSHVKSFQLNGKPYIFGLHVGKTDHEGHMWSIDDAGEGKLTFNLVKYKSGAKTQISEHYQHLETFYIKGHPYIFGIHERLSGGQLVPGVGANIWRIRDDPSEGFDLVRYGAKFPQIYDFILPFDIDGSPYLLAALSHPRVEEGLPDIPVFGLGKSGEVYDVIKSISDIIDRITYLCEGGWGYVVIYKIEGDPMSPTITRVTPRFPISDRYRSMTVFEQGGNIYLFGVHQENYANIWRVAKILKKSDADPEILMTLEYYGRNR